MAVHIKQLLLIATVAVLYTKTKAATQPMSLPNCPSKCGSVTIPYPFGTTNECSLDNTFLIDCNQTSSTSTYTPFLPQSNQSVLNISLNGELRVAWPVASDCYTETGELANQTTQVINMTYFNVSPTRNKLTAVGCNTVGVLVGADSGENNYAGGCVAYCTKPEDTVANQSCSGIGCCDISIPQGHMLTQVGYVSTRVFKNQSLVHDDDDFNPCGYAFLVENGKYSFSRTDLKLKDLELKKKEFPVWLDWAVGNQTCEQAKKNLSNYACMADNSKCYNATDRPGYLCKCIHGYRGNPYLHHGCQDINECMETYGCVKGATCKNLLGSYNCSCPPGYEGDEKNKGTGCIKKLSTEQRKEIILIIALSVSLSLLALLVGTAVLAYLHSAAATPIIHRDVKSTNILLDHNLTAKVSDFGASRIVPLDHSQINTLVQGTLGYLDPEYLLTSQLTEKSDVYSFGVVLAELLTGKKALSSDRSEVDRNLAAYFGSSMKQGQLLHILDKSIDEANIEQLKEVAHITERCLRVKGEDRPTMKEVAMELEGISVIEEHRWGSDNLPSEETENLLKTARSVKNIEDGIGGSGIINSSDSYSLNQISISIGGR
ncbi:putative wall-associated receptor kinase [Trifolium repens]|nr:putative wall-associated receptor kinase [Trifolium repens]